MSKNSRRLMRLFRRDGAKCWWCKHVILTHAQLEIRRARGESVHGIRTATVDHVLPQDQNGTDHLYNLVASCQVCNVVRSQPNNRIDAALASGELQVPIRPSPLPRLRRQAPASSPEPPVPQDELIRSIEWQSGSPPQTGTYLVVAPRPKRLLLVPVRVSQGQTKIVQRGKARDFPEEWAWARLDDLVIGFPE